MARASLTFNHARLVKLKIALTKAGRRLLRGSSRLRVTGYARFVPAGGSALSVRRAFRLS